jgi:hypothetical protein
MLRPHLLRCAKYREKCIEDGTTEVEKGKHQSKLAFKSANLDSQELFALAIYTSTANFSMFETPEWKAFHHSVNFKAPSRHTLSGTLLTSAYNRIIGMVMAIAMAANHIQIVTDGSGNISKERVENVCFIVGGISYYWNCSIVGAIRATAEWTIENVIKEAKQITQGQLHQ